MTKVKMDVMRPWIANRVTELIGFEDEVLINFIYGLLDGKVALSGHHFSYVVHLNKSNMLHFYSLLSISRLVVHKFNKLT